MPYNTLEEAQARILELEDTVADLTTERDTLSQDNETLRGDVDRYRTLSQKYFDRLVVQEETIEKTDGEPDEDIPTCEEFARDLKI